MPRLPAVKTLLLFVAALLLLTSFVDSSRIGTWKQTASAGGRLVLSKERRLQQQVDTVDPECPRPDWWCGDAVFQSLKRLDCDGDGIADWACNDVRGARAAILSTQGCSVEDSVTGWPNADKSVCPLVFHGSAPCLVPNWWCSDNNQWLDRFDCDGDGRMDWVCTDTEGRRGVIRSSQGCSLDAAATGWPNADASLCPVAFTA